MGQYSFQDEALYLILKRTNEVRLNDNIDIKTSMRRVYEDNKVS
jgi:hypothetical protein